MQLCFLYAKNRYIIYEEAKIMQAECEEKWKKQHGNIS